MTALTNAQIDRMTAEMMGWHDGYGLLNTHGWFWLNEYDVGIMPMDDWHPWNDLNQVWQVVDKLYLSGYITQLEHEYCINDSPKKTGGIIWYHAYIERNNKWWEAVSESPARAICLAALQVGEEK